MQSRKIAKIFVHNVHEETFIVKSAVIIVVIVIINNLIL